MSKLLVIPNKKDLDYLCDGYILGLKDFSVNMNLEFTIEEIKENIDKNIFVAINKNIYSHELDKLKEILKELDKLDIKGILFADTSLINIKKELNLKTSLVWSQEHLVTNYQTINYWGEYGIKMAYLSTDITLREIKEIKENTKLKLIVPIFGYIPIFTSKRYEIKNYLDNFKLNDNSKINYIYKEEKTYPIVDNTDGTVVYSNYILNGYKEYLDLDVDYVTLNAFNIEDDEFKKILKTFKEKKEKDLNINNGDKGFLYKETIYKVKR